LSDSFDFTVTCKEYKAKVLKHYENGGDLKIKSFTDDVWVYFPYKHKVKVFFDWGRFDYRIS